MGRAFTHQGKLTDRDQRANGAADFRLRAFHDALGEMVRAKHDRANRVLLAFSDPTSQPIPAAPTKSACGAYFSTV